VSNSYVIDTIISAGVVIYLYCAALKQFQVQFKVGNSYNVQQFGAKGDGVTDDQSAIDQTIARAKGTGLSVYFPPGNYLHSGLIIADSVILQGAGASTILTATNSTNGAIELTGNNSGVTNLVLTYQNPTPVSYTSPDTTPQAGAVWIQSANTFKVTQITINNSSNNGIDVFQSTNGTVSNLLITNTPGDGMQILDCNSVQVLSNNIQTINGYALSVFYGATGSQNLTINHNQLYCSSGFETFLVTGVQSGQINYNVVSSLEYGILIFGDQAGVSPGYGPVSDLIVSSNSIVSPVDDFTFNYVSHFTLSNGDLNNVQFVNNLFSISDASSSNFLDVSGNNITVSGNKNLTGLTVESGSNINILSNTILNSPNNGSTGIFISNGSNILIQNNQIGTATYGIGGPAIAAGYFFTTNIGPLQISNNQLANCCAAGSANVIDIQNDGTVVGLSITGNNYAGPANHAQYYIQSLVPGSATNPNINGNTQTTALPNNLAP